jgi:hypothetical protein
MLEEKLTILRKELIEYGTLVERMIEQTTTGLIKKDRIFLKQQRLKVGLLKSLF